MSFLIKNEIKIKIKEFKNIHWNTVKCYFQSVSIYTSKASKFMVLDNATLKYENVCGRAAFCRKIT